MTCRLLKRATTKKKKSVRSVRFASHTHVHYRFLSLFRRYYYLLFTFVRRSFAEFFGGRDVWRRIHQYPGDCGVVEKKHFGVRRTAGNVSARSQDGRRLQPADDLLRKSGSHGVESILNIRFGNSS